MASHPPAGSPPTLSHHMLQPPTAMAAQRRLRALSSQLVASSPAAGYDELPDWHDPRRYPVAADPAQTSHRSDAAAEAEAMAVLDRWMDAWNAKDLAKWNDCFNFPSLRIAGSPPDHVILTADSHHPVRPPGCPWPWLSLPPRLFLALAAPAGQLAWSGVRIVCTHAMLLWRCRRCSSA